MESVDTVVVGAGAAGLATSYFLAAAEREHVVLERGRVGETWRSQRWDSFRLNTPAWMSGLPGAELPCDARAFGGTDELVDLLAAYVSSFRLPVRTEVDVKQIVQRSGSWQLSTTAGEIEAANVVIASGAQNVPRIPGSAARLPRSILQLHAAGYRRPDDLPEGAVLVVGSAQTGGQIAEELAESGRRTFLCASRVGRVPRRYRGRDMFEWWRDRGKFDERTEQVIDRAVFDQRQPLISGTRGGHTLSLQALARDGVSLLGRLRAVHGHQLQLARDLATSVRFGDEVSGRECAAVDEYIRQAGIDAPPAEKDANDAAVPAYEAPPGELDLRAEGVATVVWCTGFDAAVEWVARPLRPRIGRPPSTAPGLYAVGFPWLRSRKSGLLWGLQDDAEHVARRVVARSTRVQTGVP